MYFYVHGPNQKQRYQKIPGSNPGQDYHLTVCLVGPTARRLTTENIYFIFLDICSFTGINTKPLHRLSSPTSFSSEHTHIQFVRFFNVLNERGNIT